MKIYLPFIQILLLGFILTGSFCFAQTRNYLDPVIDVQHYIFSISVNDEDDTIRCNAIIRFNAVKETNNIQFDLASRVANGKGMKVSAVSYKDKGVPHTHLNNQLNIILPEKIKPNKEVTLRIVYSGVPADGLIIAKNKYKTRTFFSDNWPNRAHHWLACIDHPSDKASVEFAVNAPEHYQLISNGIQVEETTLPGNRKLTRYIENVPLPSKVMVIGLANFSVQHLGDVNCIPITSWVYSEDRDMGSIDYAQATEILPFFIQKIGPYGYKKLANVQSKTMFGGMENASAIFYFENSITGKKNIEALVAHEIAHQWFGNMATEIHWSHVWLSEGFATYMAHVYIEYKYGNDSLKKAMHQDRKQVIAFAKTNPKPVVDTSVTKYMELLNANSYQKGSWVLHMLRNQVGDSAFWKGIRNYYANFAGKNAGTDDLRKIMEQASGQDLNQFFYQWLFVPGQPQLDISWQYNQEKKSVEISINQIQSTPFIFPLELNIISSGNDTTARSVDIKQKQSTFTFPSSNKPTKIVVDPNVNLLFEERL